MPVVLLMIAISSPRTYKSLGASFHVREPAVPWPCAEQLGWGEIGLRGGGGGGRSSPWGNVCPARYFSIKYPDFSPRFTLSWRSPKVDHVALHTFPTKHIA